MTMKVLQIRGVAVRVHPLFVLTMGLLAAVGRLPEVALVFGLVALHETAHILAGCLFGMVPREIRLLPVGGVVKLDGLTGAGPLSEAVVAAAGPLLNMALAFGAYRLLLSELPRAALIVFVQYNLVLAGFNLLPVLPLDGGRIARSLLARFTGRANATRYLDLIGLALIGGLIGAAATLAAYGHPNLTLMVAAAYLLAARRQEKNYEVFDWTREILCKRRRLMSPDGHPLKVLDYVVSPDTPLRSLLRICRPERWSRFVMIARDGRMVGGFDEYDAIETLTRVGFHARAVDVPRPSGRIPSLAVESTTIRS